MDYTPQWLYSSDPGAIYTMNKKCSKCKETKTEEEFHFSGYIRKDETQAAHARCKKCRRKEHQRKCKAGYWQLPENKVRKKENAHKSYLRNKDKILRKTRERLLKKQFGITPDDYERMLKDQRGACKICGRSPGARRLHVDHDHKTGIVRALLCCQCNMMLGAAVDEPTTLRLAALYLEEHNIE